MPRRPLATLHRNQTYHFAAGVPNTGRIIVVFPQTAKPQDQVTILVAHGNPPTISRADKRTPGTTHWFSMGPYDNCVSVESKGPVQTVDVAIDY